MKIEASKVGVQKVYIADPTTEQDVKTDDEIRAFLFAEHKLISWRKMAQKYGMSCATLDAYAHGREIKNTAHREVLGLAPLIPAPACWCGKVHIKGHPKERKSADTSEEAKRARAITALEKAIERAHKIGVDGIDWLYIGYCENMKGGQNE
jgi:hypothetical protein